ncbi:protoporphyrinogen oxidase [Paenibacillus sp. CAA11]|uniref:protoporphyrinogen oxidase n=1 Tax=Paenibacillus sp. CAA11 TaxID=1532905 RepID=UPI000D37999B|nr:protoporphyrinogen oxidase [Paenibacillus sp. CAA11]AWB44132.1 protoporphyrinogen oxidase [Paenibacillus sp. CAA11]
MSDSSSRDVVIIGGGLTGLSAAFYIRKFYTEKGITPHISVLEQSDTMGGKISTLRKDGFVIEKGPDSFLARKVAMTDLAKEIGLEQELVSQNPESKKTYIVSKGQLHPMPSGLVLGIPTELTPFLRSGLVSPQGKLRALKDFLLPPRREQTDESLGHFIERRLGPEVLENVTEPLLAGIYAGDTRHLSLQATFPQFAEVEREYGSLIRGMMTGRKPVETHTGTKRSAFLTFKGGLQSLITKLTEQLADTNLRVNTAAKSITELQGKYEVKLASGEVLTADEVVITTPAFTAADLLREHVDVRALDAINYVSVANVVLGFDKRDFLAEFDGSGFLVPRKEGRSITACTWTSTKWLHTSPEDRVLLRCYVGRSGEEQNVDLPDEELTKMVLHELKEIMSLQATPLFSEITRLYKSMPQYPVGHLEHIEQLQQELRAKRPGLYVTGAAFKGVGLPDCIKQAKELAEEMAGLHS